MKLDLLLDRLKALKTSKLDDFVDRLNYLYTTLLFVFFVFVVGMQQTFKKPLNCKIEANWPGSWGEYSNNYCYATGTYHTHSGTDYEGNAEKVYVNYYQWVPYVLAIQAFSFCLPHFVYLFLAAFALPGLSLKSILDRCHDVSEKKEKDIDSETTEIANTIYTYSTLPSSGHRPKSLGNSMAYSYLLSKILNLVNIAFNIYFLNEFIGLGDSSWAFTVIHNAYNNLYWDSTGFFPRITYCDLPIKGAGQARIHTVQCLLMINILIEKVYIVVYFWLLGLFAVTLINLLWSSICILFNVRSPLEKFSKPLFEDGYNYEFAGNYMAMNGALLIRFVNEHAGSVAASKLVERLATLWGEKKYPALTDVKFDDYGKSDVLPHVPIRHSRLLNMDN